MNAFELIRESKKIVIFTGAGMSTESGLPDFRSNGGLWDGKNPMEISHVNMLKKDPENIAKFYRQRIIDVLAHRPNRGHEILAEWDHRGITSAIVTQNIDGYHQRAGAKNVIELHGNLDLHCSYCLLPFAKEDYLVDNKDFYKCTCTDPVEDDVCPGIKRPNVILFGEDLPQKDYHRALQRHIEADLCIVLGSSLSVYPANSLPRQATSNGAKLIIVNRTETELDYLSNVKISHMSITEFLEAANEALNAT